MQHLRGIRYVDDYEFVFDSEGAASEALSKLQQALLEFELHLNASKTSIAPLPQYLEDPWVTVLKSLPLDPFTKQFKGQIIRFFDHAFTLANQFPTEGVLKYAAGRIANMPLSEQRDLVHDLLCQAARVEAGTLPIILEAFILKLGELRKYRHTRRDLLSKTIFDHAPQRHASEVAWSLWGCIALKIPIDPSVIPLVSAMDDSVCALLTLHARQSGLIPKSADVSSFQPAMTADELYDSRWLLAYEANMKGWLTFNTDYVANDPCFSRLRSAKVSFYDESKTTFPPKTRKGYPASGFVLLTSGEYTI